ncbi:hypothetical protein KKE47_05545 [Patescibacteria group bacterium]|nr:hypothetical protein [Patescibacteria group bacterium]MCG2702606.1 hypothetical protein [Candidatus Parcubacteria bacterium]MBU4265500.1 hypothetical protein [Patescibacteria group bacterium]MBU4390550.1 hypothetical protein [Patescibacteria group bacterium]MBU4430709.1 hypothetical protein [Patescibacteria group bacterium]
MKIDWKKQWAIDSHFLVYFLDKKSPFYGKTIEFFRKMDEKKTHLVVAQQNVVEAEKVLISLYKQNKKSVISAIEDILEGFNIKIICPFPSSLNTYHDFFLKAKRRDVFDIYLVAVLNDNGISNLFSLNIKDFEGLERKIKVIKPF